MAACNRVGSQFESCLGNTSFHSLAPHDDDVESSGEETNISMQPFSGYAVVLVGSAITETYRLPSTANLLKGLARSWMRLLSRMIGFAAEYTAMF